MNGQDWILITKLYIYIYIYIYRICRENFDTAHRKVDEIEMNINVPFSLAIFAIIIDILIFEIVLMRVRREKRSSRSRCSPVYQTLAAGGALERQEERRAVARHPASPLTRLAAPR